MAFALLAPSRHDKYDFIDPEKNLKGAADGKTILITGAGGGVGKGITRAFAQAGAVRLYLVSRKSEALERAKEIALEVAPACDVHVFSGIDIGSTESVAKLFSALPHVPDTIVNNAALMEPGLIEDMEPEKWNSFLDINTTGAYRMSRAYIKALGGKPGRIINISSNSSWRYMKGVSAYSASKVALNSLSEYLDKEVDNIRCFALHPGGVLDTDQKSALSWIPPHIQKLMIDKPPLCGGSAVYLSLDRADYLGGRFVMSTWDLGEIEKLKDRIVDEDLLRTRVVGVVPET